MNFSPIPQEAPSDPSAQSIGTFPYPQTGQPGQATPPKKDDNVGKLNAWFEMTNIADELESNVLLLIGQRVAEDYELDKDSRIQWEQKQELVSEIAKMSVEKKYWAGRLVSNVKYPMIIDATIQFASRAYPEIVKGTDVVKCKVVGKDPQGLKAAQAKRIGDHMSFQVLEEMDWEDELDQLLMTYPIVGSIFKKTYRCPVREGNVSELVMAKDLVVNYKAKSIETAERVTHPIELTPNKITERINSGVFVSGMTLMELGEPEQDEDSNTTSAGTDKDAPHIFLEQHRWWDLDGDGYQEPYIITVHKQTAKVVRICARYDVDGIKLNADNTLKRIEPVNYFTHFKFMPSTDGGFYGMGFGELLFANNSGCNAITNQLIDAGTANNRSSGFIGRGINIGGRTTQVADGLMLAPGDWKFVPSSGDDIRKNIVQMPSKEPSPVLFQMLDFLIKAGKELSSVSDIMSGESPGPNVPAASTLALIEQGMKVFTGVFKRLYRGLGSEFKKIARLNRLYLDEKSYYNVLDDDNAICKEDYSDKTFNVVPVADPSNLSNMGRALKMTALMQLIGQGFNDDAIRKRYLESLEIENPEELMPPEQAGPPPIPPEVQATIDKLNAETEKTKNEAVNASVTAIFSALQAAGVIAVTPQTSAMADFLLHSAGFVDRNAPPILPPGVQAVGPTGAAANIAPPPGLPQNTNPLFPAVPASPAVGADMGIETNRNEGVPQ